MEKIFFYVLIILTFGITSCSNKSEILDEFRPDAKLQIKLSEYQDLLTSSKNGWIGYLYPAGGGGFTFKFKFDDDQKVSMTSILSTVSANTPKESLYSLRAPQLPSLYFDTYNYIHELSDPSVTKYGGSKGEGAGGDFEFSFINVKQDTIVLMGNFRKSMLMLVRADERQGDDFIPKAYDFVQNNLAKIERFPYYYKKLVYKDKEYAVSINTDKSTFSVWYQKKGAISSFHTEYAVTDNGINLRDVFVDGDVSIGAISEIDINSSEHKATFKINNTDLAEIQNVSTPVYLDKEGPVKLFGNYSKTYTTYGVNYNGIKDYYGLGLEKSLIGAYYKQRFYIDNYDVMYYDYYDNTNKSVRYISVMRSNINTPNVIKYTVSNYNGPNPGGTLSNKVAETRAIMGGPEGFYVYPTGNGFYDLVSVSDAKYWIRLY